MSDTPTPGQPFLGDVFAGRYRLLGPLGSGAAGPVYRARDDVLARDVAVTAFRMDPTDAADPPRRLAGARMLTALDHPSLVTLYDAHLGRDGTGYLVTELVNGPSLREHLDEEGPLDTELAAALLNDIAHGLAAVHDLGIVHRHLTSSNTFLRPLRNAGRPFSAVLADFGVTHLLGGDDGPLDPAASAHAAHYLPPELLDGGAPSAASDVYALGLLALETLTGERPLSGGPMQELLLAPLSYDPEIPASVGFGWQVLLTAMTDPDPAARPTAAEVADLAAELHGGSGVAGPSPSPDDREPVAALHAVDQTRQTAARHRRPAVWAWVTHYR